MKKLALILSIGIASIGLSHASHISENISDLITPAERQQVQGHSGGIFWLTGLSGSGKSTIARATERQLFLNGARVVVLDGDNLRSGLNKDLGFKKEDREENIRRVREVAKTLANSGMIVITSLISPFEKDRKDIQGLENGFVIYVKASVDTCSKRDPKGLYKKALAGEIKEFTGVSAPFEVPENPSFTIDTESLTSEQATEQAVKFIRSKTTPEKNL